jgi:hypothetical protein
MKIFSPEKYLQDNMEIDCVNISMFRFDDSDRKNPIFQGPGTIMLNTDGRILYKIYNQNTITAEMFKYMHQDTNPNENACVFEGEDYLGIHWTGGWTVPQIPISALNALQHVLIKGQIDLLTTQENLQDKCKKTFTELYYVKYPRLPYDGNVKITTQTESKVLTTQFKRQYHTLDYNGSEICFVEDLDNKYLKVTVEHADGFEAPDVENWITQALMVSTGKTMQPKIIIRHNEDSTIMLILGRPYAVYNSMLLSPFLHFHEQECEFWKFFMKYLCYCIQEKPLDNHPLTVGFIELSSVSKSTLKNFMCILVTYIEFCIDQIFEKNKIDNKSIQTIRDSVKNCEIPKEDQDIKDRALGLLSMLHAPRTLKRLNQLENKQIITKTQVKVWQNIRPKIAHGNILEFSHYDSDVDSKRHLVCMVYRLIFQIIHYDGYALDYNDKKYRFVHFVSCNEIFKDN